MIKHLALGAFALALLAQPSFAIEAKRDAPIDEQAIEQEPKKELPKRKRAKQDPKNEQANKEEPKKDGLHALIAQHAKANGIPEDLVHRVIKRESRYNPRAIGRGGTMGLMQIKHGTARALGYSGSASGLLSRETNLTFGVRYLAGAYKVANGDPGRAIAFFARGYHYDAKRKGLHTALASKKAKPEVLEQEVVRTDVQQTASTSGSLFEPAASPYDGDPK